MFRSLPKTKGTPELTKQVLAASTLEQEPVPKSFIEDKKSDQTDPPRVSKLLRDTFAWVMRL